MKDRQLRAESRETPALSNLVWWQDKQIWERLKKECLEQLEEVGCHGSKGQNSLSRRKMVNSVNARQRVSRGLCIQFGKLELWECEGRNQLIEWAERVIRR